MDSVTVQCPWCGETVEIAIDPETVGELVQDCEVCCHPWRLFVSRDEDGEPTVSIDRA